jgi:hypothetical protein
MRRRLVLLLLLVLGPLAVALAVVGVRRVAHADKALRPRRRHDNTWVADGGEESACASDKDDDAGPPPRSVPVWPTVCPTLRGGPAPARPRVHLHLDLSAWGLSPLLDVVVEPLHLELTLLSTHKRNDNEGYTAQLVPQFWCVFHADGGLPREEMSLVSRVGTDDLDRNVVLRTCAVPARARRSLDAGRSVRLTLAAPYMAHLPNASVVVQPHPERCPAAVRCALALPAWPPRVAPTVPADIPHARALIACTMMWSWAGTPALVEWIAFHVRQGFDHLYIYHHRHPPASTPPPAAAATANVTADTLLSSSSAAQLLLLPEDRAFLLLLQGYVDAGVVTVVDWPRPDARAYPTLAHDRRQQQIAANNHCLVRYGGLATWTAVFDMDEYVRPVAPATHPTVLAALRALKLAPHETTISLRMHLYRERTNSNPNSTRAVPPPGPVMPVPLVTQSWMYTNARPYPNSRNKLILRASAVGAISMHRVTYPRNSPVYAEAALRLCHYRRAPWPDDGDRAFRDEEAVLELDTGMAPYGAQLYEDVAAYLRDATRRGWQQQVAPSPNPA